MTSIFISTNAYASHSYTYIHTTKKYQMKNTSQFYLFNYTLKAMRQTDAPINVKLCMFYHC